MPAGFGLGGHGPPYSLWSAPHRMIVVSWKFCMLLGLGLPASLLKLFVGGLRPGDEEYICVLVVCCSRHVAWYMMQ